MRIAKHACDLWNIEPAKVLVNALPTNSETSYWHNTRLEAFDCGKVTHTSLVFSAQLPKRCGQDE